MRQQPHDDQTVKVLLSFKEPHSKSNPYITQLRDSLAATSGAEPICFTWRTALTGQFDVFHAHWPESLIEQRGLLNTLGRRVLYATFLARLILLRVPVVRTVHNLTLPSGISRLDRLLLKATERLTVVRITLNPFTPVPSGSTSVLIEHGHYRDWFASYPRPESVPGRVTFFGKVRRYKNVEGLLRAFRTLPSAGAESLHVVGTPSTPELADTLREIVDGDSRVDLAFRYVDDAELVREVSEACIVVLPYPEMHNSGSVLAALSLDRTVLVPDNDFNRALAEEVGPGWVIRYQDEISSVELLRALDQVERLGRSERPDLSRRDWVEAGQRHLDAYHRALGKPVGS